MRRFLFVTALLLIAMGPSRAGTVEPAGGDAETVMGMLGFVPEPDVSICFCGSFLLAAESPLKDSYLVSNSIDLGEFVGRRILVYGRSSSGTCRGTLARPCAFFEVEKVVALSSTGAAQVDWGTVKMIYR